MACSNNSGERLPPVLLALASVLDRIVCRNAMLGGVKPTETLFHGKIVPWIPIDKYLERIFLHVHCSDACWVISYIFLDKFLKRRKPDMLLEPHCVHRVLLAAVVSAIKYQEDVSFDNRHFAVAGGVSLKTMNKLEMEFLKTTQCQLFVNASDFNICCAVLQNETFNLMHKSPSPPFTPSPPMTPEKYENSSQFLEELCD